MGLFRTSLISATFLLALAHAQDDDGFDLPELPPPAVEQPASVQPAGETAPNAEAPEAAPLQEDNYAGPQNDAMDAPEPEQPAAEQVETTEPEQATAAEPTSETVPDKFGDTPPKIKVRKIPDNLDRPVRVGVFVDEKKLFVKQGNQTVAITAIGNQLEIESGGTREMVDQREFFSDEKKKCLNIAPTEKQLKSSCYPGYFIVKASKSKVTAINIVEVEDYVKQGVVISNHAQSGASTLSFINSGRSQTTPKEEYCRTVLGLMGFLLAYQSRSGYFSIIFSTFLMAPSMVSGKVSF